MSVEISRLPNGLTVVTDRADHVETASVGLWVGTGARAESAEINGVAHLIEHMVFKGTARRSALDIAEEIEAVGGHLNAYTTREHTAFHAKVLKEDLALAFDIVADMVLNPALSEDELGRERSVVLQEIGQAEDTPDDIIFDHLQAVAFPDQPIGRPVLGTVDTIRGMPRDALVSFMGAHYGARQSVLAAAGNVAHETVVGLAAELFGSMPEGRPAAAPSARYAGGETRRRTDLEQAHLLIGFPGLSVHDDDLAAQSVYAAVLGGGMSSRLFQEVRERRGLAYSVFASASSYADAGILRVYAGTGRNELSELVAVLCHEITRLAETVTADEIARGKAQLKAGYLMGLESMDGRAEQHAVQLLRYGRVIPAEEIVARIEAVDRDALSRIAARLLAAPVSLAAAGPIDRLEPYAAIRERLAA